MVFLENATGFSEQEAMNFLYIGIMQVVIWILDFKQYKYFSLSLCKTPVKPKLNENSKRLRFTIMVKLVSIKIFNSFQCHLELSPTVPTHLAWLAKSFTRYTCTYVLAQ